MRLLDREPKNLNELKKMLSKCTDVQPSYSVAVEALLFDSQGNWILMRRGPECQDEIGKLEGIGGTFEGDQDFRSALRREIIEEVGNGARIDIVDFFEVRKDCVDVPGSTKPLRKHWVIVSYICLLRNGELKICEPGKNLGFVRTSVYKADMSELSSSTASALVSLSAEWPEIEKRLKVAQTRT